MTSKEPGSNAITLGNNDGPDDEHILGGGRFEALARSGNGGNLLKYRLSEEARELEYRRVIELWGHDREFVDFYLSIFNRCGFDSYVWETPPVSTNTLNRPFEFVLYATPRFFQKPDPVTFAQYFDVITANQGIVAFPNLGHDATLVVPSPYSKDADYSGLAMFLREAPVDQQRALWVVLAQQIGIRLSENPTWVSVAGGGVAWLHIRLDSEPKYYRHIPYIGSGA